VCPSAELLFIHVTGGLRDATLKVASQGMQLLVLAARQLSQLLQLVHNAPGL
jgi:hypothetical protein